ncbi:MAG TPA: hypothetical protein VFR24_28335 [Candidatus Angelobacter sp.]|nr:hypothetical protein [Candidatus Angelobacter sp.]
MMKSKNSFLLVVALAAATLLASSPQAQAKDDFGQIVKHIEVTYHVHRQHRFVMGMAGFVVKFWHFAGVKNFKGAIFENQPFVHAASDTRFNEVMREAMESGWHPMVQSWDRHSGERTYIYAQDLGKDLKVLVVSLESNEAVVIQVKVDPHKLDEFIREASMGKHEPAPGKEIDPPSEQTVEVASLSAHNWNGVCLQE